MSTLTVCPYCGEGMRFDHMKHHFLSCTGRSPLPRSQSSKSPSPAKAPPVSGLEFYNQLNKLSALTRSRGGSSSTSHSKGRSLFAASPEQRDAATVRELMYPSTSLTIDIAPSRSATSASSCELLAEEAPQTQHAPSSAMGSVSPLNPPPPPSVRVQLDHSSHHTVNREGGERGSERVGASLSSSRPSTSARATEAPRARLQRPGRALSTASRSRSRSSKGDAPLREPAEHTVGPTPAVGPSERASEAHTATSHAQHNTAPSATLSGERAVNRAPSKSGSGRREGTSADSAVSSASTTSAQRPTPQLSSFAIRLRGSGDASSSSVHQLEESSADHYADPMSLVGRNTSGTARSTSQDLGATLAQLSESLHQVRQLVGRQQEQYNALLHAHTDLNRQVASQQGAYGGLLRRSLDQATAVEAALQRHTTQWRSEEAALSESVAALWANVSDIQQRLPQLSEAAPSPPLLQEFPTQALPELHVQPQHAVPSSVSSSRGGLPVSRAVKDTTDVALSGASPLKAHVKQQAEQSKQPAAGVASSSHISVQRAVAAEESTYYSDIGSFIHPDVPVFSAPASAAVNQSGGSAFSASTLGDFHSTNRSVFSHMPATAHTKPPSTAVTPPKLLPRPGSTATWVPPPSSAASSLSHTARRSATLPRVPLFVTDVLQQQHQQQQQQPRVPIEDRVVAMLHAKPTVVVRHSPWSNVD